MIAKSYLPNIWSVQTEVSKIENWPLNVSPRVKALDEEGCSEWEKKKHRSSSFVVKLLSLRVNKQNIRSLVFPGLRSAVGFEDGLYWNEISFNAILVWVKYPMPNPQQASLWLLGLNKKWANQIRHSHLVSFEKDSEATISTSSPWAPFTCRFFLSPLPGHQERPW